MQGIITIRCREWCHKVPRRVRLDAIRSYGLQCDNWDTETGSRWYLHISYFGETQGDTFYCSSQEEAERITDFLDKHFGAISADFEVGFEGYDAFKASDPQSRFHLRHPGREVEEKGD